MNGKGIIASEGIGIGKVLVFEHPEIIVNKSLVEDVDIEISRFNDAIDLSVEQLSVLHKSVETSLDESESDIFKAHIMICKDVEALEGTIEIIKNEKVCAEYAYDEVMNRFINMFESMEDDYMRERAADLKDVSRRVLRNLLNLESIDLSSISEDTIIIASDLTPSETSQLNACIQGFITMLGGKTSHSAIIARSLELPSIVGLNLDVNEFKDVEVIIVDAINNCIICNPTKEELEDYNNKRELFAKEKEFWKKQVGKAVKLPSGKVIKVSANVATDADLQQAIEIGADGIGLLRTEFLYMETKSLPDEEKQYGFYKKALDAFPNEKVVIRTLDIGGDKQHPYFDFGDELNPFLGVRAIRLCFEYVDVFKTQINAMLRANTHGNLCIMFPMIATVEEFLKAKEIVEECYTDLVAAGFTISDKYELGTMVEIPSVAITADEFAKHVDFFSIGTNDLIQYTMASDRMNQKLNYLYQPMHPAITRLIENVVSAGKSAGIWTGMCGEMAGDPSALNFLAGIEIDELSMNTRAVLRTKHNISNLEGK